ncbi:hypothetical protein IV102_15820 [bacterium]|nr:hypothetical protein [bacterium]
MRRWVLLAALFLPGWGQSGTGPTFELQDAGHGMITVIVRNPSTQSLKLSIPAQAVLTHPQLQDQLLLDKARTVSVAPQGQSQFRTQTMCVGERQEATQGGGFQLSLQPHPQALQASKMLDTCRRLQSEGDLPPMPMLPGNQVPVVAQWAYWSEQGQVSKADFSKHIHAQLKPEPKDEPEVEKAIDNTWEAIDLTRKEAKK